LGDDLQESKSIEKEHRCPVDDSIDKRLEKLVGTECSNQQKSIFGIQTLDVDGAGLFYSL